MKNVALRSFLTATWLGWKIESNWTDPLLFAIYSIIKPLAGAAIIVVMYSVITNGNFSSPMFAYLYLGNAFYQYVGGVMTGVSWAIVDDREHYRTLKYIYIAPVRILFYLLGRGMAKILTTTFSVAITIGCGVLFLQVPLNFSLVNWPLFILAMITGVVMLTTMGLLLAGIALITVHHSDFLGDAVAGALYLFSGAVFPLEVLPVWLRPVGYALPITYWLELIRRTLVGKVATAFPTFAAFSDAQLFAILIGSSVVFALLGTLVFRLCDRRARERGLIDRVTNY